MLLRSSVAYTGSNNARKVERASQKSEVDSRSHGSPRLYYSAGVVRAEITTQSIGLLL
jgi:hypothetical protein